MRLPEAKNTKTAWWLLPALVLGSLPIRAQAPLEATEWLTTPDRGALMARQAGPMQFGPENASDLPSITIDDQQTMQTIDGFGFALTGGSAQLLMRMSPAKRHALLQELFGTAEGEAGVSYLRVSIGSSDMNERVFTYDDLPPGQTDPKLRHFALGPDLQDVVPVLREILAIEPSLKILATPWSAPSWMKTNGRPKGGSLRPELSGVYARYLVRYIEAMRRQGITIDAITPQNEPLNPQNTPSMVMTAGEEARFIREALGPALRAKHLPTKIVIYDHNCDHPEYPLAILADPAAARYVDGTGFHLYGGNVEAMTRVHDAYPDKHLYFTEQMVVDEPDAGSQLRIADPVSRIVIGATANWARNVLLWNLAADPSFGPHTGDGGCPVCEGAITLDGDTVTRNLGYYTIAQTARFVRPGAVRIASSATGNAPAQVAFRGLDGSIILLAANPTDQEERFVVRYAGRQMEASLPAGAAATYVWRGRG